MKKDSLTSVLGLAKCDRVKASLFLHIQETRRKVKYKYLQISMNVIKNRKHMPPCKKPQENDIFM